MADRANGDWLPSPLGEGQGVGWLPKRCPKTIDPTPTPPLKGRGSLDA